MLIKYYKHSSTSQVIIQCKNNVHITENRSCRSFSCRVQYQYHRTFVGRPLISEGVGVSEPWGSRFREGLILLLQKPQLAEEGGLFVEVSLVLLFHAVLNLLVRQHNVGGNLRRKYPESEKEFFLFISLIRLPNECNSSKDRYKTLKLVIFTLLIFAKLM